MFRIAVLVLVVCTAGGSVRGELIGLRWTDTSSSTHYGMGTVEVYVKMMGTADYHAEVSGVHFGFAGVNFITPAPANLRVAEFATAVPGWSTGGVPGPMGNPNVAFGVGGGPNLIGPGEYVLGTFLVMFDGPPDGPDSRFSALVPFDPLGLTDGVGTKFAWNALLAGGNYDYSAVGFDPAGYGNPGWGSKASAGHQPIPSPLIVAVPEPAGLALVLMVGLGTIRRRRHD